MKPLHELTVGEWVVVFDRMRHEKQQLAQIVHLSPSSIEACGYRFSRLTGYCLDEDNLNSVRPAMADEMEWGKK